MVANCRSGKSMQRKNGRTGLTCLFNRTTVVMFLDLKKLV